MVAIFRSSKSRANCGGYLPPLWAGGRSWIFSPRCSRTHGENFRASLRASLRSCQQRESLDLKSWETPSAPISNHDFPYNNLPKKEVHRIPQFQTNPDQIKWVKYLLCISTLYDQKMCGMFTRLGFSPQSPTLHPHNPHQTNWYIICTSSISTSSPSESILQHEFEVQKSSPSARFGALQSYQRGVFGEPERING